MRQLIIGRRPLFALITALAAIAGIIGTDNTRAVLPENDEVSISARILDDGRIEFALWHVNLEWDSSYQSEYVPGRVLPAARYFPSTPEEGRWLYSSVERVSFDRPGNFSSYDVRIAARRLPDGRTEFGLRRWLTTQWSDVLLPDSRFFPTNTAVGRWLRSSEISLTDVTDPVPTNVPVRTGDVVLRSANLDGYTWNGLEASLYYGTEDDPLDDTLFTWVGARTKTDDSLYDTIRIQAACLPSGSYNIQFWEDSLPYDGGDPVSVRYRIDDGEVSAESWYASRDGDSVFSSDEFERAIIGADKLVVRMSFYSRTLTATFTGLRAMWNTPVQPNLDYCGRY